MPVNRGHSPSAAPPPEPLFTTLVASRPRREGRAGILASVVSVALHIALVGLLFWATMEAGSAGEPNPEIVRALIVPIEPAPPPPPPPPLTDAPPLPAPDVRIGSIRLMAPTVILPDIPAPDPHSTFDPRDYSGMGPEGRADGNTDREVTAEDPDAAPRLTPMTVRPTIRNRDDVARALQRFYPPLLRDAGIGGTVVLWLRIDAEGNVVATRIHESSGQQGLDEAALRIGEVIEFTPAMNRDRRIPVWVQWPINFRPL